MFTIPAARTGGRARALLLVLCGTIFLGGIDVAMPAVAVPTIRAELGPTTGTAAWGMSGYVYAAMFPGLLLAGIAFALTCGPLTIAATDRVAEQEQGLASGLFCTFTQFGSAVGISAVCGIAASPGAVLDAYRTRSSPRRPWCCGERRSPSSACAAPGPPANTTARLLARPDPFHPQRRSDN
ncbi:hypothetical protein ACWEIJ_36195 [Lentzea sp. NPDC004789]